MEVKGKWTVFKNEDIGKEERLKAENPELWNEIDNLKFTYKTTRGKGEIIRWVNCMWKGERHCLTRRLDKFIIAVEILNAKRDYEMVKDGLKRCLLFKEVNNG